MSWRYKTVCVTCRAVYAGSGNVTTLSPGRRPSYRVPPKTCVTCGGETTKVSYKWRAPKKRNDAGWREIERGNWLWENKGGSVLSWAVRQQRSIEQLVENWTQRGKGQLRKKGRL